MASREGDVPNKYDTVLEDLGDNVVCGVENFYEKYFENKSWSEAAGLVAEAFEASQTQSNTEPSAQHKFETDPLGWILDYAFTLPPTLNQYRASTRHPSDDNSRSEGPTLYLAFAESIGQRDSGWANVQVLGQASLASSLGEKSQVLDGRRKLCLHAWRVFNNQTTRCFIHGFYIYGRHIELWVFDRRGAYTCRPFDIDSDADRVLRVIAGYALMNKSELGNNPCIHNDGLGDFVQIHKASDGGFARLFLEDHPIRKFPGIVYSGPTCYRARRSQSEDFTFVVKFAWRRVDQTTEEDITGLVTKRNIWGAVRLFGHLSVTSIDELRHGLDFSHCRVLSLGEHICIDRQTTLSVANPSDKYVNSVNASFCCVAISPVGRPMQEYTSSSEVLEAFRDIAKGHHSLYFDGQILHRDVSKDNIMISISPHGNGPRGFLIDLDVAQRLDKDEPKEGSRFGTRPFMAIGVLLAQRHTYKHDLESLFYCFLWTAICGKGNQWPPTDSKLWAWFRGSFKECALRKSRDMDVAGFEGVLEEFSEDFVPHKGLARSLWKLFFPHQGDLLVASRAEVSSDPFLLYRAVAEAFDQALL